MDSDTVKLLIAVLSSVVAVYSAVSARQARTQSRRDTFETQRDLLLLSASENDARLKAIGFRCQLLEKRLQLLTQTPTEARRAAPLLEGLRQLAEVAASMQRREWRESTVRAQEYSEEALKTFRQFVLVEQETSKALQVETHFLLFQDAEDHIARLTSAT